MKKRNEIEKKKPNRYRCAKESRIDGCSPSVRIAEQEAVQFLVPLRVEQLWSFGKDR